jgi:hypothetical protein
MLEVSAKDNPRPIPTTTAIATVNRIKSRIRIALIMGKPDFAILDRSIYEINIFVKARKKPAVQNTAGSALEALSDI